MTADYKPHPPAHYPIAWTTAARLAVERRDREDDSAWVSVDWAKGTHSATMRMKRLRTFREGLVLFRHLHEEADILRTIDEGYMLTFRKKERNGVWDVQLRWKKVEDHGLVEAALAVL